MTKFVGQAWRNYKSKYQASHTNICKRAGMLVSLDGHGDGEIKLEGVPSWIPAPHIELDDELRQHYKAECTRHIIPAAVDLDLFTCIRVLCVMWIRSLVIRVRVLFSYFSLSFDVSGGAVGYNFQ